MKRTRPDGKAPKGLKATRPRAARTARLGGNLPLSGRGDEGRVGGPCPAPRVLSEDLWHVPTSARRAAALNRCCPKRVARAIEGGELPGARAGRRWFRVTPAAVRDWLLGRSPGADAAAREHAERVVDRVLGRHTGEGG